MVRVKHINNKLLIAYRNIGRIIVNNEQVSELGEASARAVILALSKSF